MTRQNFSISHRVHALITIVLTITTILVLVPTHIRGFISWSIDGVNSIRWIHSSVSGDTWSNKTEINRARLRGRIVKYQKLIIVSVSKKLGSYRVFEPGNAE